MAPDGQEGSILVGLGYCPCLIVAFVASLRLFAKSPFSRTDDLDALWLCSALSFRLHRFQGARDRMNDEFDLPDVSQLRTPPTPGAGGGTAGSAPRSAIEQVLDAHSAELLSIDGVVGVGIQTAPTGGSAIALYLQEEGVKARVPRMLDGYPVISVVSGEFSIQ